MSNHPRLPATLDTPRLALEPFPEADAETYRAILGLRVADVSHADLASYLYRVRAGEHDNVITMYALRRRIEGDIIGYCALIVGRATVEEPEIAYELLPTAHNQGYATEAAAAVIAATAGTGRSRLWSTVRSWNTPSFRVLEKNGFRRDHTTTDTDGDLVWNTLDLREPRDAL